MSKWNPADHLPECGVTRYPICICDRLRDCEKRVREDERREALKTMIEDAEINDLYAKTDRPAPKTR